MTFNNRLALTAQQVRNNIPIFPRNLTAVGNTRRQIIQPLRQIVYPPREKLIRSHDRICILLAAADYDLCNRLLGIDDLLRGNPGILLEIIELIFNLLKMLFQHEVRCLLRLKNILVLLLLPVFFLLSQRKKRVNHQIQADQCQHRKPHNQDNQIRHLDHHIYLRDQHQRKEKNSENQLQSRL